MKVLIVDDEVIARIGLTNAIDWEANGFYIVGDAADAETAKNLARTYKPDIVIVDIMMPDVNGLDLIQELRQIIPMSRFIIISCMDDKEYYKRALELSVEAYINKATFRNEQLLEVLQKARKSISKGRIVEESYDETYHLNRFAMLSSFLNLAIRSGGYTRARVHEKLRSFDIDLQEPYCLLIIGTEAVSEDTREYIEQSASVVCYDIVRSAGNGFVFRNQRKEILAIVTGELLNEEYLKRLCQRIQTTFEQYFGVRPPIGSSGETDDFGKLKEAYKTAQEALQMRFFYERALYSPQCCVAAKPLSEQAKQIVSRLMSVSLEDDPAVVQAHLEALRQAIVQGECYDIQLCRNQFLNFLYHLYNLSRLNDAAMDELRLGELEPTEIVEKSQTLAQLAQNTANVFLQLHEHLAELGDRRDYLIKDIEDCVRRHIHERIRIEDIAGEVHLSPAYLGRLYKKATGVSLHAYINCQKVEFSKQLLLEKQDVNAVAEALDFSTTSYYISQFKQQVGMTPKQYRMSKAAAKKG